MMIRVKVLQGQTNIDLAIRYYGSADHIDLLIQDNPDLVTPWNAHLRLTPGTEISIKSIGDIAALSVINAQGIIPVSAPLTSVETGDFNDDFNNDFNI